MNFWYSFCAVGMHVWGQPAGLWKPRFHRGRPGCGFSPPFIASMKHELPSGQVHFFTESKALFTPLTLLASIWDHVNWRSSGAAEPCTCFFLTFLISVEFYKPRRRADFLKAPSNLIQPRGRVTALLPRHPSTAENSSLLEERRKGDFHM